MIDDRLVEHLKLMNLTEYESRTYLALVAKGTATVKEIRELAGIPYSREYDILESLERRGYVVVQPGRPRRYRAVDPREVLSRELEIRARAVEELIKKLAPIYSSHGDEVTFDEVIWMLKGRENIHERLIKMLSSAEREVLILGMKPVTTRAIARALRDARDRGVEVRALGEFDDDTRSLFEEIGVEYRYYPHDHSRFVLVDERELILASEDPANYVFALYNRNPGCIKLYRNYFHHVWKETRKI
ncbi:MAG: TrmB family transcriptional regulator [Euryarchaeota archaeon]|nr:TrmB family transcriptional regulator [Euryarchaeota archaeon]